MPEDTSDQNGNEITNHPQHKISNLERREIQSPLVACVLAGFISEMGYERAMRVASAAIRNDATRVGKTMAEKYGGNSFEILHRIVKEVWAEDDALEFSILEETEKRLSFNVTRCRYVELYDRLGLKEFGFCLSCNRDASLIDGFNPRMKLLRSQTIMQGAEMCDFRIVLE